MKKSLQILMAIILLTGISRGEEKKAMTLEEAFRKINATKAFPNKTVQSVHDKNIAGDRPIHIAAALGDVKMIEVLLANGADVNSRGEHQLTPLMIAVEDAKYDAVVCLVEHGAKDLASVYGDKPVTFAKLLKDKKILDYLRKHGFGE